MSISAEKDVQAIIAAATTPELAALERQLVETIESMNAVSREIPAWMEKADRSINTPLVRKTDDTMAAAAQKVSQLEATRAALMKTAADLRSQIALVKPAFMAAVAEKLAPIRARAANDIQISANSLYAAIERFNSTSEALKKTGTNDHALVLPVRIPTLDHFLTKVAQG